MSHRLARRYAKVVGDDAGGVAEHVDAGRRRADTVMAEDGGGLVPPRPVTVRLTRAGQRSRDEDLSAVEKA